MYEALDSTQVVAWMVALAIGYIVIVELYKYLKDLYWFRTWNFNRQWQYRQCLNVQFMARNQFGDKIYKSDLFRGGNKHYEACEDIMKHAHELTRIDSRDMSNKEFSKELKSLLHKVHENHLTDELRRYEDRSKHKAGLYARYGHN